MRGPPAKPVVDFLCDTIKGLMQNDFYLYFALTPYIVRFKYQTTNLILKKYIQITFLSFY